MSFVDITGLGGRDSSHVNWKDAKEPVLMNGEKLIKVHVVRSRPLADSSLARALGYRARVVDLLQKRIEVSVFLLSFALPFAEQSDLTDWVSMMQRALLEGSGLADESEEHSKEGESGDDYKANVFRNYGREPGDITQLSSLAPGSPISNRLADTGHSDSRKHADDYNGIEPLILTQGQFSASFAAPSAASPMEELKSSPFKAASPLKTPRTTVRTFVLFCSCNVCVEVSSEITTSLLCA